MKTFLLRRAAGVVEDCGDMAGLHGVEAVSLHNQMSLPLSERCHNYRRCGIAAAKYNAEHRISYVKKAPEWVSREAIARAAAKRIKNALGKLLPSVSL